MLLLSRFLPSLTPSLAPFYCPGALHLSSHSPNHSLGHTPLVFLCMEVSPGPPAFLSESLRERACWTSRISDLLKLHWRYSQVWDALLCSTLHLPAGLTFCKCSFNLLLKPFRVSWWSIKLNIHFSPCPLKPFTTWPLRPSRSLTTQNHLWKPWISQVEPHPFSVPGPEYRVGMRCRFVLLCKCVVCTFCVLGIQPCTSSLPVLKPPNPHFLAFAQIFPFAWWVSPPGPPWYLCLLNPRPNSNACSWTKFHMWVRQRWSRCQSGSSPDCVHPWEWNYVLGASVS